MTTTTTRSISAVGFPTCEVAAVGYVIPLADFLLRNGADREATDHLGQTLLLVAAQADSYFAVRVLLEFKVNIEARDMRDQQTALQMAARHGSIRIVQNLLNAGADVDARDKTGRTALHHAADIDTIARLSVDKQPWLNERDRHGIRPLIVGWDREKIEAVQQLLGRGANPNLADAAGRTPLLVAGPTCIRLEAMVTSDREDSIRPSTYSPSSP
jgi:uncharacterized protein